MAVRGSVFQLVLTTVQPQVAHRYSAPAIGGIGPVTSWNSNSSSLLTLETRKFVVSSSPRQTSKACCEGKA